MGNRTRRSKSVSCLEHRIPLTRAKNQAMVMTALVLTVDMLEQGLHRFHGAVANSPVSGEDIPENISGRRQLGESADGRSQNVGCPHHFQSQTVSNDAVLFERAGIPCGANAGKLPVSLNNIVVING